MRPSNQVAGVFSSPEASPSATSAAAAANDEDNIFGVGADDTFFSIYALASTPPPPTSNATRPALQWPSSAYSAPPPPCEPSAATAPLPTITTTTAPSMGVTKVALPASKSFDFGGSRSTQDRLSPQRGSSISPSPSLQSAVPPLFPCSSSPDPAGGDGLIAPVDAAAAAAAAAGLAPTVAKTLKMRPPATATNPASRPAKSSGSSVPSEKGGACQGRKSKSNARKEGDPDDPGPDTKVCLLAVGTKQQQQKSRADGTGNTNSSALSLGDMVEMLTVEIDRNGRETETEYVETGQRAVLQVEALARFDLRYGIVVLEVEESLAAATATARQLRFVGEEGGWLSQEQYSEKHLRRESNSVCTLI